MLRKCDNNKTAITEYDQTLCNGVNVYLRNDHTNFGSLNKNCCVCLNGLLPLNSISKTDENELSLFEKLQINIPQIDWQQDYYICEPCTNLLNIVNNFRTTCLQSNLKRQELANLNGLKHDKDNNSSENDEGVKDVNEENDSEEEDNKNEVNNEEHERGYRRKRRIQKFPCEVCSSIFLSSTTLVKHCVNEHDMIDRNVRPFACTRCDSRFGNSSNLLQHVKYHDAVRSSICSYCGKGFITKTDLIIHEKQHLNKREYVCEVCNKSYNTHKDLRSHKHVVHADPETWKYFCQMCNKRFPIKSNYDCHMRRHTGDKKFECHLCNKKFTDKCVLQRHMRTHTNIRDFKCSECGKEYKDKRVMQIHMAKVHGIGLGDIKLPSKERKYQCHICPKAYYAKNKLTRHLYTHSGEKPFYCTLCDKKFNDKSYVKQHMKKSHNIETNPDS